MIGRRIGWGLTAMLCAAALMAQSNPSESPRDLSTVETAPLGGAIAIDIPEGEDGSSPLEIPELAGTLQATGSQLVDGELPPPFVDYSVRVGHHSQRITIFETGLVAVRIRSNDGQLAKKVILPPDALAAYRKELRAESLSATPQSELTNERSSEIARLRIYESDGDFVEREFDPAVLLPRSIDRAKTVMEDLLRAIAQDREVTSTVTGYTPAVGDRLVSSDRQIYEVVAVIQDGAMVELRGVNQPLRMYVAAKDLHDYFIGARRQRR